ncbi:molybdate ABC transporter substrate-binding protein [Phycicoccus sonneratiae]|uniref:Molybdate ABC transporter substrate-binding protein n=1 Tax=Phycicoccus sonneratiae TaxID=2807628 RepID=A0ABS2CPR4_9MICO|nr:molybdate ABC transporter substrate-binding protein [Phycicoccus sonneraticus]MBM6401887.1 molybdate ABC transporter substrate-binding protein [Phycicoccus sonneraticus]
MRRTATVAVVALAALGLAGCGSDDAGSGGSTSPSGSASASSDVTGQITVLAAASLTESFTTLGKQFEAAHPGVKVTLSFGASSALATQVTSGAPADVFASASTKNMDTVVAAGAATDPKTFAENVMEIAVPPSNPGKVTGVDDLARADVKTALCQEQVPCGATAAKVFENAELTVEPVTLEPDVKSVLSKVTLGEVDAGVVYVTDVKAAGADVEGIEIPTDVNASTSYPIAALSESENAATAAAFVDYVLSADGAKVLAAAGFRQP